MASESSDQRIDVIDALCDPTARTLCLIGASGSGKTTSIRRYIWEQAHSGEFTIVVNLRDYARDADSSYPDIGSWLHNSVSRLGVSAEQLEALNSFIELRSGVFVFDGFDELAYNMNWATSVATAIAAFFAGALNSKVIVTARTSDDLLGQFPAYSVLQLLPVDANSIREFAALLEDVDEHMVQLLERHAASGLIEGRPAFILMAILSARYSSRAPARAPVSTLFDLWDWALDAMLLDRGHMPQERLSSDLRTLSNNDIRIVRSDVLMELVNRWPSSSRPLEVAESVLKQYVQDSLSSRHQVATVTEQDFKVVVPTGICLELFDLDNSPKYRFLHNSIQEFLYARMIRNCLDAKAMGRLDRDYFSDDVLAFLSDVLTDSHVFLLLSWAVNTDLPLMIRKVSISVLGHSTPDRFAWLRSELSRMFDNEDDIGVAGRLAEALRQHGDDDAMRRFVGRLGSYGSRTRMDRTFALDRDLTYEVNLPLPALKEFGSDLRELLGHDDPTIRKHALILLLRSRLGIAFVDAQDYCLREVDQLGESRAGQLEVREYMSVRSLRYGLFALATTATPADVDSAISLRSRVRRGDWSHEFPGLLRQVDELIASLSRRS